MSGRFGERGLDSSGPALGRVAGLGEDPLTWAIYLGSWKGVRLGVHSVFPIWALAECAASLPSGVGAVLRSLTAAACYFGVVLVRELARAWWASRAGRGVHEIVAWPLGGFASFGAISSRASGVGELGGVIFTAILAVPVGGFLWALGAGVEELARGIVQPSGYPFTGDWIEGVAFWVFHASVVLTLFNVMVPMSPFDIAHAIDRQRARERSPVEAAGASLRRGIFVAFVLFTGAAVGSQERLMALGVLGALATWIEYRRVMFLHSPMRSTMMMEDRAAGLGAVGVRMDEAGIGERVEPLHIDDVLAKITRSGLSSLSVEERRALEEATRRSRGEPDL